MNPRALTLAILLAPGLRAQAPVEPRPEPRPEASLLRAQWSVGNVGILDTEVRAYKPTYVLLARWSDNPNDAPQSPSHEPLSVPTAVQSPEAKFQFSFKFLLASFAEGNRLALWATYSQQSHWQLYNAKASRPFRETNYEPELLLAWLPDQRVLGMNWSLLSVALTHQSNGRANPLSRSWNRLQFQAGFDKGNFMLLLRPWIRLNEDPATDDNPDLEHYLGHGEVVAAWKLGGHTLAAQGRLNASTGKGAFTGTWSFPLARKIRGHVQVFSGYGESLIDYNWRQNTVGIGVSLADWL